MKIVGQKHTVDMGTAITFFYEHKRSYQPTEFKGPFTVDPPLIAELRKEFYGKPNNPDTALAMSLFAENWNGRREARWPEDWGKKAWIGPYSGPLCGRTREGHWILEDGTRGTHCEVVA